MRRALLAALVALLVLVAGGCTDVQGTEGKEYVTGDGQVAEYAPDARGEPVEASGTTLDGDALDLASLRGQVVVVNVWGSWCVPCRTEAASLVGAAADLGSAATFVGVNIRDSSKDQAQAFERAKDVPYPSLYDPSASILLAFRGKIRPNAIPSTAVLDREGRLAALVLGQLPSKQTLVDVVEKVVSEGTGEDAGSTDG